MAIKFGFSDECGNYLPTRNAEFLKKNPFYVRTTFLMDGDRYKCLCEEFIELKAQYGFPNREIKWSYIWSIRSCQNNRSEPKKSKPYHFLKDVEYHELIRFAHSALRLLCAIPELTAIITYTDNSSGVLYSQEKLYTMHIRTLLQRVQMQTQKNWDDLAVLFFDPVGILKGNKNSEMLRNAYHNIYNNGDFVEQYSNIKDSLNFENSHHSTGIQLADFMAGCFVGFLKGYEGSTNIFNDTFRNNLRIYKNSILGAGICEVPTNEAIRSKMEILLRSKSIAN